MTLQEPGDLGYNEFHVSLFYLATIDSEHIQNPNVIIALKNLAKKTVVTKEKRLGEFLKMLESASFDVRDYHILVCWLQLYPRLAIDSLKSIRNLAHQILAAYTDKYGPKEFSRYWKTAMPIWLQGLFDDNSIANSVRANLLRCFSGDEAKVTTKIWIIFHEQIINYCHAVLVHESASSITDERSESAGDVWMKYERAVNSALLMFLQVVRLANTQEYFINETTASQINDILILDQFWGNLASCASKERLNTALFRSYLTLISEVFSLDEEAAFRPFTAHLKETKLIFKTVSKKFIKNVKLAPASEASLTIIYSTVILPLLSALTSVTNFSKQKSIKIKKSFWQYSGLKGYSRLKDILKLGPCNSDPSYYDYVEKLFSALKSSGLLPDEDFPFIDFSSAKDASTIIQKILLPQYQKIRGYNVLSYKYQGMHCLIHIFELFANHISDEHELGSLSETLFLSLLDGVSISRLAKDDLQVRSSCITQLARFHGSCLPLKQKDLSGDILERFGEKRHTEIKDVAISSDYVRICTNFYLILHELSIQMSDAFLQAVIERLELTYDSEHLLQGFTILINALSETAHNSVIENWAAVNLAGFVSKEFVELPLKLVGKMLESDSVLNYGQLFNNLFLKISDECPHQLTQLLTIMNTSKFFKYGSLESAVPDVYLYLLSISRDKNRLDVENETALAFSDDPDIFVSVLNSTEGAQRQNKLIASIVTRNQFSNLANIHRLSLSSLISCALDFANKGHSMQFLESFEDKDFIRDSICEKVLSLEPDHNFSVLATMIARNKGLFPLEKIESEVNKALECVDLASLAISNPLSQNINLIRQPTSISLSPVVLVVAAFLKEFSRKATLRDDSITVLTSICAEYLSDYEFLASPSEDETTAKVSGILDTMTTSEFLFDEKSTAQVFSGTATTGIFALLLEQISGKGVFTARQYYISRVLVRAMTPVFEAMSLLTFNGLEILYTKLSNHPLKIATLLCSAKKFVGSSVALDRIRNFVFAEILGVRSTAQICESGLVWLSLANSFTDVDTKYDILPSRKLGMLVNHLAGWLECDIAFDDLFIPMRTVLASCLSHFIQTMGAGVPDMTWGLAVDLCLNNLGIAQVNRDTTALEYFSLKLFVTLTKCINKSVFEDWRQSRISIEEEVLMLTIAKSEKPQTKVCHQPAILVYDLFERILQKATVSKEVLAEHSRKFYRMLSSPNIVGSQKIACLLLKKHIYESQQDAILEGHMRKSTITGESGSSGDLTSLNPVLLEAVSDRDMHLEDVLDNEEYGVVFRYLWSWVLIFDHFKESTYSMKADYINLLKANESITFLLNTVFDTLPFTEQAFLKQLVRELIEKSEKAKPSQFLIQNYEIGNSRLGKLAREEAYFLLAHLCYQTYQFLGSFALHWFDEIRDVQLKQQVGKFSTRFVSPILISKMLQEVEQSKDKLTKNDDTLTIKVNRVTNEVRSVYVIDEQTMEMLIKVPEKFPLSNVSVEGPVRLGVKENQWKAWLMASQRVITLINGSIFDSIELFNKNVNLHFSGFEECAICYSILHQDHSLPSKNCPTCLNKFHAACLYKWFKSSGSSTCPLCRSAFNFNAGRP